MTQQSFRDDGIERLKLDSIGPFHQHYIVHRILTADIKAAAGYAQGNLLDIGCGNKPYEKLFSTVNKYVGCDIAQSSENVVDVICFADKLSFEDASFDTVFSTQVIEHVDNFPGMIAESYRVLKKQGYLILTAPFCWELHEEPYDFHRFSKYGLQYDLEKAGFEIIEIKPNGGKWAAIFQMGLNVLFSTRKYRTFRSRLVKLIFVHLRFIYLYNKLGAWLDQKYFDPILTLNYLVVAKKPS
jgi:SAM-dependent methyltransferase